MDIAAERMRRGRGQASTEERQRKEDALQKGKSTVQTDDGHPGGNSEELAMSEDGG